jgi:uncharacterized Zn finger protein
MAKGNKCPSCGAQKFQPHKLHKAVCECSSCGSVGWLKSPASPGAGKGTKCGNCDGNTVREIYSNSKTVVFYCTSCRAVYIPQ